MTNPSRGSGARREARARLDQAPECAAVRAGPPVFHFFEELYARTLREVQARSTSAVAAANR